MSQQPLPSAYQVLIVEGRLRDGSPCWTAVHPDLPGCNATGRTPEDARAGLDRAREAWLNVTISLNETVPAETANPVESTIYLPDVAVPRALAGSDTETLKFLQPAA